MRLRTARSPVRHRLRPPKYCAEQVFVPACGSRLGPQGRARTQKDAKRRRRAAHTTPPHVHANMEALRSARRSRPGRAPCTRGSPALCAPLPREDGPMAEPKRLPNSRWQIWPTCCPVGWRPRQRTASTGYGVGCFRSASTKVSLPAASAPAGASLWAMGAGRSVRALWEVLRPSRQRPWPSIGSA
jgi:hypothetical protein